MLPERQASSTLRGPAANKPIGSGQAVPGSVETPTVDHEGHAADIALLKSLRTG